ncbi:MAG: cell division protein FtsZ [Rikenellaceae bacterium]
MNDDIMETLKAERGSESIIMVAGVGGAGGNAVRHMYEQGIQGVEFMICNTDQQSLDKSPIENKIKLGREGLGAGSNPEIGRLLAIESLDAIKNQLVASNTKMLFITAGMGGGTGTGASPVIAKMAKEQGILTVAIVTSPLSVEGSDRFSQAVEGIKNLREHVDSLLIINNDNIIKQYKNLSLAEAFGKADDILCSAAKGIAEIITVKSDLVNVDFADVRKVMTGSGTAHMSVVSAEGENRAETVAKMSLTSPLLDRNLILGAKNILVNFVTAQKNGLGVSELDVILKYIQSNATYQDESGKRHTANIIWGTSTKPNLGESLELVVVATGFGKSSMDVEIDDEIEIEIETLETEIEEVVQEPTTDINIKTEEKPKLKAEPKAEIDTTPVILGNRESRYADIDKIVSQPAYKTRKIELIVTAPNNKTELLKEEGSADTNSVDDSLLFN